MNKPKQGFFKKRFVLSFLIFILFFSIVLLPFATRAQLMTSDPATQALLTSGQLADRLANSQKSIWDKLQARLKDLADRAAKQLQKVGTQTYQTTLRSALNILAYDTASFIFSGGEGQKSLFTTEYWSDYATKAGDAALGKFINGLSKEWQVDLCKPSLPAAQVKIGLGLYQSAQPEFETPDCGWQDLKSNYSSVIEAAANTSWADFGGALAKSFDPTGNDVTVALTLFDRASGLKLEEEEKIEKQLEANNGWLDVRNAGGKAETTPGEVERTLVQTQNIQNQSLAQYTGNALQDAANIFLNQAAITAFNTLMKNLAKKASGNDPVTNFTNPDSTSEYSSGSSQISEALKKIIKPQFNVRADYDVLADLTICVNPDNPAPTNCVIDDRFSQAIQNRNSVIEAVNNGYINGGWVFDREADYTTAFNYRTLMILRKFRIIPVGWEEALTRAEEKTKETGRYYTLMDMISCYSPDDEYETFSSGFSQSNFSSHTWCQGLIDPTWILKSSMNYCKRQGYGGYIESKQLVDIDEEYDVDIDPIVVSRSNNYCADEQSCIKEKTDGSCEYYGYCTEEKRTWNFGEDSCDPVYNTCESYTSSSSGKKLALLKNTIDYGSCDSSNVGCAKYAVTGIYSTTTSKVSWNDSPALYFDKDAEACSSSDEGCEKLVRTASGVGHNFLLNGSFESNLATGDWQALESSDNAYAGNYSARLSSSFSKDVTVAPSGYSIAGESYTLSFYSICTATSTVSLGAKSQTISPSEAFTYQAINYTFPSNYSASSNVVSFNITPNGGACSIDNIKLEKGVVGTYYSENKANGVIYQKMMPEYLKSLCYVNPYSSTPDYRLKLNAPEVCKSYARQCNKDEVACRLFTSVYNIKVAAKALEKDYCPEQCIGYDIYAQKNTLFESSSLTKLIPSTAEACSAAYAGCTEFTNLDELAAGGEGKEYYTHIKHCIKPSQGNCQSFYSWGGTSSGYQLESYSLERDASNWPKVTEGSLSQVGSATNNLILEHQINGSTVCSSQIFELDPSDAGYNPDCRQFYTQDGDVIYLLYSRSITCSEACKTYRMTDKNIDASVTSASSCVSSDNTTSWDASNNVCYRCLGGGRFDTAQNACLYQAIPGEGQTCSAASNGCREYNGNAGNNVRNIKGYNFNDGLNAFAGTNVLPSTESLTQGGKSMALGSNAKAQVTVADLVKQNSSYVIRILMKNTQARGLQVYFKNGDNDKSYFNVVGSSDEFQIPANSEWQLYQLSLGTLDHAVSNDEELVIEANGSASTYISSIVLSEIDQKYYLLKNSWSTPEVCYYDTLDNYRGVNYNLGCQKYVDQTNASHNLRQFSSMCSDSSLGCELMVKGDVDEFIMATYDTSKACSSANKGCTRFGKVVLSNNYISGQNVYEDVYLKNDTSRSDQISCSAENVGCDAWSASSASGVSYFKDPGDNLCQWRKGRGANDSRYAWYKKDVKKCQGTNNVCSSAEDCASGQACELDTTDYLCPVDNMKTIGYGGDSAIWQPRAEAGIKWAGLCPIKEAGCTEYIDPVSSFSPNIVINPNFSDMDGDGTGFDMWTKATSSDSSTCSIDDQGTATCNDGSGINYYQEDLGITPNKLYVIQSKGEQTITISCSNPIYKLNSNNTFASSTISLSIDSVNSKAIFYSGNNNASCSIRYQKALSQFRDGDNSISLDDIYIKLSEAVINYQLKQNLDFSSCNGQADSSKGCVLFNQREYNTSYTNLNFSSKDYANYSTCSEGNCDANVLMKVTPDRTCGRWLSCFSYTIDQNTGEKNCSQMMECTAFNYDGSCLNFAKSTDGIRTYSNKDANASGYSILGTEYLANMNQVGRDAYFADDFETGSLGKWYRNYLVYEGSNSTPVTKYNQAPSVSDCLVNRPNSSAISGKKVSYPASGKGFLKVGDGNCSGNFSTVEKIPLTINTKYYLSFMVNTDDLSSSDTAKVKFIGYNISGGIDTTTTNIIYKKSGWHDAVLEIDVKKEWKGGVVIQLESSNGKPVYFDDFRITPVLEKGEVSSTTYAITSSGSIESSRSGGFSKIDGNLEVNKFVAPTCRLYPTEDSLLCESSNKNFSSSGWYGYCLQKDPKNPDVCLMWYPIDSVKGSRGSSGSTSAFSGYASTGGARPYYCAEMSADFDIVYKVEPFYSGVTYMEKNNESDYPGGAGADGYYMTSEKNYKTYGELPRTLRCYDGILDYFSNSNSASRNDFVKNNFFWFMGGWENSRLTNLYAASLSSINPKNYLVANSCSGACDYGTSDVGCGGSSSDTSYRSARYICSMGVDSGYDFRSASTIAVGDKVDFSGDISKIVVDAQTYCTYKVDASTNFTMNTLWDKWSSSTEAYFNSQKNSNKPALDLRIMAYNYGNGSNNEELCNSLGGKYYNCSDSTKIKCPAGRSNACLLSIDKYVPLCSKVVQGEVPWSQRLKTSPYNVANYAMAANSLVTDGYFFNSYYLNTAGIPFGAVVTNGDALNASSTVFAGSAPIEGAKYGVPYSCGSNGQTSYVSGLTSNNLSCATMYFNGSKIVVAKNMTELTNAGNEGRRYIEKTGGGTVASGGTLLEFKNILKVIWLKVSAIIGGSSYNFSNVDRNNLSNPVIDTATTKTSATDFKAVLPKVSNITLSPLFSSGLLNAKSKISSTNNVYTIEKAGFYVLSFNTTVDAEQMPIKKLSVRIKNRIISQDPWDNFNSIIDLYNIDPMPDSNNPHKVVRYLQKGDYYVLIKLEDNWGFYQCLGRSSFLESCCPGDFENPVFTTGCSF